ncbi:MAG: hypothetical protein ABWZ64_08225 [Xanthobacteraceae bacterium]|jgi:hypothetical protein
MRILGNKYAVAYWARKCLGFLAVTLLAALAVTQWVHTTRFARHALATDSAMMLPARGGQLEQLPLW